MSAADAASAQPVSDAEAALLFADLAGCKALVLAVSGGPDSTALLVLAARWRAVLSDSPTLLAVTVDHGLRPEGRKEAAAVKRLAASLGVAHRTLRWTGPKPASGLQEAARAARYRLLAAAARRVGARCVLTAHMLDDQAETVLFRLARGSGISGLGGMSRIAPLPLSRAVYSPSPLVGEGEQSVSLVRPFLDIPKARLVATLEAGGIPFAEDPSNRDPRFTRARLRELIPALAAEGLSPQRLVQLARRARRADAAIEAEVDRIAQALAPDAVRGFAPEAAAPAVSAALRSSAEQTSAPITIAADEWARAPAEIRLRLLGRLIGAAGKEGAVELAKLEACEQGLIAHHVARRPERFRRTLAGAVITLAGDRLTVATAPPRRIGRKKPA